MQTEPLILGIDPGSEKSGFAFVGIHSLRPASFGVCSNASLVEELDAFCKDPRAAFVAYEQLKSYGAAMGDSMLDTATWTGRFIEAAVRGGLTPSPLPRKTVVSTLTGSSKAGDSEIRRFVLDFYAEQASRKGWPTGGGKEPASGTSKQPGVLYGVNSHAYPALAVCLAFIHKNVGEIFG